MHGSVNSCEAPERWLAYLRGQWLGVGHSPLAALSVLALLALLLFQSISGLMANDDIAFRGPLYDLVSKSTSNWLTGLHRQNIWLIGGWSPSTSARSSTTDSCARTIS
jgi:cytochrome b